jgi:hypothetical protein
VARRYQSTSQELLLFVELPPVGHGRPANVATADPAGWSACLSRRCASRSPSGLRNTEVVEMGWERRGQELSRLFLAGRDTYLQIDDAHHGRPELGSTISADWTTLSHLDNVPWPAWLRGLASLTARSLAAVGAEYLAGLAVLYAGPPTLLTYAHYPIVRALVESLGQSCWILSPGLNAISEDRDDFARQRAARAYLTLCVSDHQRLRVEGQRSGENSTSYRNAERALRLRKESASRYFRCSSFSGRATAWSIENQRRPTFTGFSRDLMEFAYLDEDGVIKNPYAFLSSAAHANIFSIFELATSEHHGDHGRHIFAFQSAKTEVVARFVCQIFSIATELVAAAHGWEDDAMARWHHEVQEAFAS